MRHPARPAADQAAPVDPDPHASCPVTASPSTPAPPRAPSSAASSAGRASSPRGCPRCGPSAYEVLAPPPRLVHRAGHAWEQLVLPLRAARAAGAAVPGQPRAAGVPAQRRRDPRRRRAAPSRVVLAGLRGLAAARPPGPGPSRAARRDRIRVLARRARRTCCSLPPERVSVIAGRRRPRLHAGRRRRARPRARSASPARTSSASPPRPRARTWRRSSRPRGRSPPTGSRSSSRAGTGRSSPARPGSRRCATSAPCRTRCCPGSTRAPRRSRCRRSTRASACPCSRRWRAARPVIAADATALPDDRGRSGAAGARRRRRLARRSARSCGSPAERARLRAAGLARAAPFTWDRTARARSDAAAQRSESLRRAPEHG